VRGFFCSVFFLSSVSVIKFIGLNYPQVRVCIENERSWCVERAALPSSGPLLVAKEVMLRYTNKYDCSDKKGEQYKLIRACTLVLIHIESCKNYRKIAIDPNIIKLFSWIQEKFSNFSKYVCACCFNQNLLIYCKVQGANKCKINCLRQCLLPSKFQKFYKIPRHIESLDACMEY
jgi:hypothetical protein